MNIALVVVTRKRPNDLTRFYQAAMSTAAEPGRVFVGVRIDNDDAESLQSPVLLQGNVTTIIGPRRTLSSLWNEPAILMPFCHVFFQGADDIVFETPGWDNVVEQAITAVPDRLVLVHGNDGYTDGRVGTHNFVTREWVGVTGFFSPPWFVGDVCDKWLTECANAVNRRVYLPQLMTRHLHFSLGLSSYDATHHERLARIAQDNPEGLYHQLLPEREAYIAKLQKAIHGTS